MSPSVSTDTRNSVISALFFALCWAYLFFVCPFHLVYKEQMTLFVLDGAYVGSLLARPAFLAVLAGDFLTQFFIYRAAAALITILVSVLLWDGLRRILRREGSSNAALCALIPTAASIALSCHLEYPLSMALGAALAVWMAYGCSSIRNFAPRLALTALAAAAAYPLAGAHALLFVIFAAVHERKRPVVCASVAVLGTATILLEGYLYGMIWQEALTYPLIHGYSFRIALTCLVVEISAAVSYAVGLVRRNAVIAAALAVLLGGALAYKLYDAKLEYDLKISTLAYFGKWDKVKAMGAENPYESQTGAYYHNLAAAREGTLPDDLLTVYQPLIYGLFLPVTMNETYLKVLAGADALIECGDYGQAQHSAMLGMTFMPNQRSSRAVRRLAQIAVYNGDTLAADRYLWMLRRTLMHRRWACDVQSMLDDGTAVSVNCNRDTVYFVNDFQTSLRNVIETSQTPDTAIDYLLCYDLLSKNLVVFLQDYDRYYLPRHSHSYPPRIYQEALEMLEMGPEYNISRQVKADNQMFLGGLERKFRQSYWFYFKYAQSGNEG